MDKHVTSVGVLFIAFGAQGVFLALVGIVAIMLSGNETVTVVGLSIVLPFLLLEALKIVGGIALFQHRRWARVLVLVLSFLSLIHIPIGTAYSIYAIWVLMKDDTVRLLANSR